MNNLLLTTIPKSGSHILAQALECTPCSPFLREADEDLRDEEQVIANLDDVPDFAWGHVPFSTEIASKCMGSFRAIIFLYRDPADICVSMGHFIDQAPFSWFNQRVSADLRVQDLSIEERILFYAENYGRLFGWFTRWKVAAVHQVRYEDLMQDMPKEMYRLREYVSNADVSIHGVEEMVALGENRKNPAWRSGEIGEHTRWFDPNDHKYLLTGLDFARVELGYK